MWIKDFRDITNKEDLESVRYVRVRSLRINFDGVEGNTLILKRDTEGLEVPLHRLIRNGEIIESFVLLKDAKEYILKEMIKMSFKKYMPSIDWAEWESYSKDQGKRSESVKVHNIASKKRKVKSSIFKIILLLTVLGISIFTFIHLLNK